MKMNKSERQKKLVSIITASKVRRQDELARALQKSGFAVTQASVSRDLDELGIIKADGYYSQPREGFGIFGKVTIGAAGDALVVARCAAGMASAAAVRIDAAGLDGIVGTIAGDDTIFVAVKDRNAQRSAIQALHGIFG